MKFLLLGLISTVLLSGCMSTTPKGTLGADRKQLMLVTSDFANKKAEQRLQKMTGQTEKKTYSIAEERLVRVMNSLIPYADEYVKDGRKIKWGVHLMGMKYTNAGALQNGVIVVSTKLAFNSKLTDGNLAFILSHEMAHVLRQHNREMDSWRYVGRPVTIAAAFSGAGAIASAAGMFHDVYSLTYNKVMEKEADKIGLDIMTKAGYKPEDAADLFEKFKPVFLKEHPVLARIPAFLITHPSFDSRIRTINKKMPELTKQYEEHDPSLLAINTTNTIKWDFSKNRKNGRYSDAEGGVIVRSNKVVPVVLDPTYDEDGNITVTLAPFKKPEDKSDNLSTSSNTLKQEPIFLDPTFDEDGNRTVTLAPYKHSEANNQNIQTNQESVLTTKDTANMPDVPYATVVKNNRVVFTTSPDRKVGDVYDPVKEPIEIKPLTEQQITVQNKPDASKES